MINSSRNLKLAIKRGPVLLPGAFDALSSLIIERVGFKGIYVSGAAQSVTQLGLPDIGYLTLSDMARVVNHIRCVTTLPLLVDADTGFGGPEQIPRTVQVLETSGASGIQIEDQVFPKRCGHLSGKSLISLGEMVRKIKAAVESRKNKDFLVVARTDARGVYGMREALRRARIYKLAGADIIFPEALRSREEFAVFGEKKNLGSLMANMTEFGLSPALTASELAHLGFRVILFPMTLCRISAFSMEEALREVKEKGTSRDLVKKMQTRRDLYKLIHYQPKPN